AIDQMYQNALDHQLGAGSYTKLDLQSNNPFRSAADLRYGFGFFQSVLWYEEFTTVRSATLAMADEAIRAQLAAGKNFYVTSASLVGTNGALDDRFLADIVG